MFKRCIDLHLHPLINLPIQQTASSSVRQIKAARNNNLILDSQIKDTLQHGSELK